MVDRITIQKTCHMNLDGQWQIVLSGTVVDVPDAQPYVAVAPNPTKNTGTLHAHGKPTSVSIRRGR